MLIQTKERKKSKKVNKTKNTNKCSVLLEFNMKRQLRETMSI